MTMSSAQREMLEETSDEMLAITGRVRPYIDDGSDMMKGRRAVIVADSIETGDRIHALLQEAGLSAQRLSVDTPIEVEDDGFSHRVRTGDIVVIDSASFDAVHDRMLTERMGPSCIAISDLISSTNTGYDDVALLVSHEDAMKDALRVINLMTDRFVERMLDRDGFPNMSSRMMDSLFGDETIARERRRSTVVLIDDDRDLHRMAGVALKMAYCERPKDAQRFDNDAWNKRQGRSRANMRGHGKGRR